MKTLNVKLPGTSAKEDAKPVAVRKTGGRGSLNIHDILKGLLLAGVIAAGSTMYESIQDWLNYRPVNIDWQEVARSAVKGGIGYLTINVFQPARIIIKAKALQLTDGNGK